MGQPPSVDASTLRRQLSTAVRPMNPATGTLGPSLMRKKRKQLVPQGQPWPRPASGPLIQPPVTAFAAPLESPFRRPPLKRTPGPGAARGVWGLPPGIRLLQPPCSRAWRPTAGLAGSALFKTPAALPPLPTRVGRTPAPASGAILHAAPPPPPCARLSLCVCCWDPCGPLERPGLGWCHFPIQRMRQLPGWAGWMGFLFSVTDGGCLRSLVDRVTILLPWADGDPEVSRAFAARLLDKSRTNHAQDFGAGLG